MVERSVWEGAEANQLTAAYCDLVKCFDSLPLSISNAPSIINEKDGVLWRIMQRLGTPPPYSR